MKRSALVPVLILCGAFGPPAAAQAADNGDVGRSLQSVLGGLAGKMGAKVAGAAPAAEIAPAASTRFRRDPAVSKQVETIFVDGIREFDAAAADELANAFKSNDIFGMVGDAMQAEGLSGSDAADCLAVYLLTGWQIANGVTTDPGAAEMKTVSAQMSSVLRSTPDWVTTSDAEKQKMAEGLLLQAMMFDMMADAAAADPATLTKVRSDVREGMKATFQVDPGLLQLTANGLSAK